MIDISEFFLPPNASLGQYNPAKREFQLDGKSILSIEILLNGTDDNGRQKYILRQFDLKDGVPAKKWNSDWLLRKEADGSLTEYGDQYPKDNFDWFSDIGKVIYVAGHEIRWAENATGTAWPNPFQSTISHIGSYGTFLCKAIQPAEKGVINRDLLDIYMEQKFRHKDMAMYHCRRGHGIYAITYYAENGNSVTIREKTTFTPSGN